MNRRSFLRGAVLFAAAPAIVRVASIMPVGSPSPEWVSITSKIPGWMIMNPDDWNQLYSGLLANAFGPGIDEAIKRVSLDPMCPRGHTFIGADTSLA